MNCLRQTARIRIPGFVVPLVPLLLAACADRDPAPPPPPAGCLQASAVTLRREEWQYASRPATERLQPRPGAALRDTDRLGVVWYEIAATIHCSDLFPDLTADKATDPKGLGVILVPNPGAGHPWAALTQRLSPTGIDLNSAEYIELWLNDFNRFHGERAAAGVGKELRIDLGLFSEDAVWDPQTPPAPANGRLDDEDLNSDGNITPLEDLGLDAADSTLGNGSHIRVPRCSPRRVADFRGEPLIPVAETPRPGGETTEERYHVASEKDPAGDDFGFSAPALEYSGDIPARIRRFRHLNGTEDNQRLDTEDLTGNHMLDTRNDYFEYTIPLHSDNYAIVDVRRDYGITDPGNGWRLLRIPLADANRRVVGQPDLGAVQAIRIWFEGFSDTTEFWIASLRVGSGSGVRPAAGGIPAGR